MNRRSEKAAPSLLQVNLSPNLVALSGYQVTNQKKNGRKKEDGTKDETKQQKWSYFFRGKKTLDQLYLKGPASFGNPTRLKTQSKLTFGKVKTYLETKPSFTKYRPIGLRFPRLKVIVKDINEN